MERLRRVLVERYIGLVMVCAFFYQALVAAGQILEDPFNRLVVRIYNHNRPMDNWILPMSGGNPASMTIWQATYLLISLLIAIGLYRWVYPSRKNEAGADSQPREES